MWRLETAAEGGLVRAMLAQALTKHAGLTQREAAAELGLGTGAAVSLQLRRLQEAMEKDPYCRRQWEALESHLVSFKG